MIEKSSLRLIPFIFLLFAFVQPANAEPVKDDYLQGYASAVLESDFDLRPEIQVREGVVYIRKHHIADVRQERIRDALMGIEGVREVEFVEDLSQAGEAKDRDRDAVPEAPAFLKGDIMFSPLIADPRWPHFSASYQDYSSGIRDIEKVGAPNFGESFSIYRFNAPLDSFLEIGIQAGVFAIFDLDAPSYDLINADYFVGIPLTFKKDFFSLMTRVSHQSSHLGDEFILRRQPVVRENISYEAADGIMSFDLPAGFRLYLGGGYLFDTTPDLEPYFTHNGLEFRSPWSWFGGAVTPVAAVDVYNREENDWDTDVSVRAGVQFKDPDLSGRKMMILLEYYDGNSPNGQFFRNKIEYLGIGLHLFSR